MWTKCMIRNDTQSTIFDWNKFPNQEEFRTLGKKENYKYSGILQVEILV